MWMWVGVLVSVHRHELKCVYGSSQLSVLSTTTRSYGAGLGLAPTWLQAGEQALGRSQGSHEASPVVCLLCLITRQLFNYASCMPAFIAL